MSEVLGVLFVLGVCTLPQAWWLYRNVLDPIRHPERYDR